MTNCSLHFKWHEFACKGDNCCNHSHPVDKRLLDALEHLRALAIEHEDNLHLFIHINSGFRCNKHNAEAGGAPHSFHTLGMAADVVIPGLSPLRVAALAKFVPLFKSGGIGVYDTFTHLDIRPNGPTEW